MNNMDVIALKDAGVSDELLISKIRNTSGDYRLETEDLIALKTLPAVTVSASAAAHTEDDQTVMRITVKNPSKSLGFQVHLRVTNGSDEDILPILFDDNYFPLFPGEERTISARYDAKQLSRAPTVVVEGWNVQPLKVQAKLEGSNAPTHARATESPVKAGASPSRSGAE